MAEIAVKPDTRLAKGETLFRIDPTPFGYDVRRLEAALAAAEQNVRQLKASLDQASAASARSEAPVALVVLANAVVQALGGRVIWERSAPLTKRPMRSSPRPIERGVADSRGFTPPGQPLPFA